MGHKQRKCLVVQAYDRLDTFFCPGLKKHDIKVSAMIAYKKAVKEGRAEKGHGDEAIADAIRDKIFSYTTLTTYRKHVSQFLRWVEEAHKGEKLRTLEACRPYVEEWLNKRITEDKVSPYTSSMEASAIAKLYQCPVTEFKIELPKRTRKGITRSRGVAVRDKDFSEEKNKDIVNFCRCTGLRRIELTRVRGTDLVKRKDGNYYVKVKGKGGRVRYAPIIGHVNEIVARMRAAGDDKVWERIPSHMDVHGYRAEYATLIYQSLVRNYIPKSARYECRADLKGVVLDEKAMLPASEALGHGRLDIVAGHYIRL